MKLAFTHYEDLVSADCQVIIDCAVEWSGGHATLRIDDIYDTTGRVSLIRLADTFWKEFAGRIVDAAEDSEKLLEEAIERWNDEREAA